MSNMLMSKINQVRIGHKACCDWDDETKTPSNRKRARRNLKRSERQQWRKDLTH